MCVMSTEVAADVSCQQKWQLMCVMSTEVAADVCHIITEAAADVLCVSSQHKLQLMCVMSTQVAADVCHVNRSGS